MSTMQHEPFKIFFASSNFSFSVYIRYDKDPKLKLQLIELFTLVNTGNRKLQ